MKKAAFLFVLIVLVVGAAGGWVYLRLGSEPYRGYDAPEQFVEIPAGAGSRAIGDRLVNAGIVRDALSFRVSLYLSGKGRRDLEIWKPNRHARTISPGMTLRVQAHQSFILHWSNTEWQQAHDSRATGTVRDSWRSFVSAVTRIEAGVASTGT